MCVLQPRPPPPSTKGYRATVPAGALQVLNACVCVHRLIATLQITRSTPQRAASFDRASEWFCIPSEMISSKWPTFFARASEISAPTCEKFARFEQKNFASWDRQIRSNRANFFATRERNIGSNMREISLKPSEFFALGTDKFARTERTFSPPASEMSAPTGENFRSVERSFSHAGPPNIGPEAAKKFARTERIFSPTASEMLAATDENFRSSEQTVSLEALKFRSF